MAQAPPGGGGPTGNAISDANLVSIGTAGVQFDPATTAALINTTNQQAAAVSSDCLWPPSGQITVPIIPGLFHQSVNIPCLVSYSEARALVGAGLFVGGIFVVFVGVNILTFVGAAAGIGAIVRTATGGSSPKKAATGGGAASDSGAASTGSLADASGTSPEFRAAFLAG